jgi:hypothetical protein
MGSILFYNLQSGDGVTEGRGQESGGRVFEAKDSHCRYSGCIRDPTVKLLSVGKKCSVKEERRASSFREIELRPEEVGAIVEAKQREPWLSHRQISGRLREQGIWVSESSCYRVLKAEGWVEERQFRERPWEEARYEPYRPNQIWGLD